MKTQNYGNHVRLVPAFHFFLVPLGLITLIAAIVHFFVSTRSGESPYASLLIVSLSFMAFMTMLFARRFACKAQDRAIRAEENLRHFALTGKLPDPRLTISQMIALRFASDEEYLSLYEKALNENMTPDSIKRAVKSWRADYNRV